MAKIKLATCAMHGSFNREENLKYILAKMKEATQNGAKLICFPEAALQGYLPCLTGPLTTGIIRDKQINAEILPEGASTQAIINASRENDIYVVYGMIEQDKHCYDVLYNSAVLVGPEGFIGSYRKVHQPIDEKHVFMAGDDFPVYDTSIGKIGMQICFDKEFPECAREMALKGAEIICTPTAWEQFIGDTPENNGISIAENFDIFDCARAIENQIWIISSNWVGNIGGGQYCGKSNIVDPTGYILATCGQEEKIVYAEVDIKEGILQNRAERLQTNMRERKPHAYKLLSSGLGVQNLTELQSRDNVDEAHLCD